MRSANRSEYRSPDGEEHGTASEGSHSARFPLEALSTDALIDRLRNEPLIQEAHQSQGEYRSRLWFKARTAGQRAEELSTLLLQSAKQAGLIPEQAVHDLHAANLNQATVGIYKIVGFKTYLAEQPCQDAAHILRDTSGKYLIAASSDGAGGMPLSHYGAELISRISTEAAASLLEKGLKPETSQFMGLYYRELYARTHEICRRVGVSPEVAGNTFLAATSMLTLVENRGNDLRISQISLADGAFLSGEAWQLIDKLPDQYPENIREAASLAINYPNMIISALAKDFEQKIPRENHVRDSAGEKIIERIARVAQTAVLLEQKSGKEFLVRGVANASDGITHTLGSDRFPMQALISAGIEPEQLRKLALLFNVSTKLEDHPAPHQKILFAKLCALRELYQDFGEEPLLRDLFKISSSFLDASLAQLKAGEDQNQKFGSPLMQNIEEVLQRLKPALDQDGDSSDAITRALKPFENVLSSQAQKLLTSHSREFASIDYSKAQPTWDDVVVVHVQAQLPDLSTEALPETGELSGQLLRNRAVSQRTNNFLHFLPGGYQRNPRFEGALLRPERADITLGDWLDAEGFSAGRITYSEKRLSQTGLEFIAEIDRVALELGFNLEEISSATQEYQRSRGKGESVDYLTTVVEPIFNALIERGYTELDLKT